MARGQLMAGQNHAILAYAALDRDWPQARAQAFATTLPYAKRLALPRDARERARTLLGIALARCLLAAALGRRVVPGELSFPQHGKPHLADAPDFSIAHSGRWVGCAVATCGLVGFDLEESAECRSRPADEWVAKEAAVKALGLGVAALREARIVARRVELRGRVLVYTPIEGLRGCVAALVTSCAPEALELRPLAASALM